MLSRRQFVIRSAGVLVTSSTLFAQNEVPTLLDHILLGSHDLQLGIDFVAERTGVGAVFGGVHPGRGTQNALLSLGERRYLEVIAPDPAQPDAKNPLARELRSLKRPRLVGWAAHPGNLQAFAEKLRAARIAFEGPTPGSRKRPDGRVLEWQTLSLADNPSGLLPFFIEWSPGSPHPSTDAPEGCSLLAFAAETPNPLELAGKLRSLGLDLPVGKADYSRLHAVISGPKGKTAVSS